MKNKQSGFAIPLLIIIVALLVIGGGVYVYLNKESINSSPVACTMEAKQCPDGSYVGRTGLNCEFVCPELDDTKPIITSISQSSGSIGTVIELKGNNLAGFEGDLDAWIENSKGEIAFLPGIGSTPRDDQTIKVKIESKLCKTNNTYSGLPCESYLDINSGVYNIYTLPWGKMSNKIQFAVTEYIEMDLALYIQDKEVAATRDCGVTKKVIYQVPKTTAVADVSLKILFSEELSRYGVYKSVSIVDGVAKVMLESDKTKAGFPMSSLSSCESSHLLSVLKDTLTQYSSIKSVELFSPQGVIQF